VLAFAVGLVQLDLDTFVAVDRHEHLVQCVGRGDDVAGSERPRALGEGPDFDHHILGKCLRRGGGDQHAGNRSSQCKLPVHEIPPRWSMERVALTVAYVESGRYRLPVSRYVHGSMTAMWRARFGSTM